MKTKIFILGVSILMIATTTTFTGCKKYPDGPWMSARTKKARLAQSWKNEFDPNETLKIDEDGRYMLVYLDSIYYTTETGKWDFSNTEIHRKFNPVTGKHKGIVFYGGRKGSVTFYSDNGGVYTRTIEKLEKKELWLDYDKYIPN